MPKLTVIPPYKYNVSFETPPCADLSDFSKHVVPELVKRNGVHISGKAYIENGPLCAACTELLDKEGIEPEDMHVGPPPTPRVIPDMLKAYRG